MFNRLPPEFGDTPTKVEFEGIDPGSPAAKLLQLSYAGEVSSFLQKARQQRILSENGVSYMQQTLPDGGQLRYQYNNGMETLVVRLTPRAKAEALAKAEEKRQGQPSSLLAIDLLFAPELYLTADVYSFEVETREEREWIWEPGDPIPVDPSEMVPAHGNYWTGSDWFDPIGPHYGRTHEVLSSIVIVSGQNRDPQSDYDIAILNSIPPSRETGIFIYNVSYVRWHETSQTWQSEMWMMSTGLFWEPGLSLQPTWHGRLGDAVQVTEQVNSRDQYSFFDVLTLAALRVEADPDDPASTPYEATSLGGGTGDKRLQPITVAGQTTVTRALVAAETAPSGFAGAGFIARPRKQQMDGDKAKPTVIDVYLATSNNLKANEFPGTETATFESDDPSFDYDYHKQLTCSIRVREYIDGEAPAVVGVTTTTEKRHKHFTAGTGGEGVEPTIEGENEDSASPRTVSWKFAAKKGWVDQGGEPADPMAEGMGQLLSDLTITKEVNPAPATRTIRQAVQGMAVSGMTKVATIEWTPSTAEHKHGSATITPA